MNTQLVLLPLPVKDLITDSMYDEAAHIFCDILQLVQRTPEGCSSFYRNTLPSSHPGRKLRDAIVSYLTRGFPLFRLQEGELPGSYVLFRPDGMSFTALEAFVFPR